MSRVYSVVNGYFRLHMQYMQYKIGTENDNANKF